MGRNPDHSGVFIRPGPIHRLQLDMSEEAFQQFQRLKRDSEIYSNEEVIRVALDLLKMAAEADEILIFHPDAPDEYRSVELDLGSLRLPLPRR